MSKLGSSVLFLAAQSYQPCLPLIIRENPTSYTQTLHASYRKVGWRANIDYHNTKPPSRSNYCFNDLSADARLPCVIVAQWLTFCGLHKPNPAIAHLCEASLALSIVASMQPGAMEPPPKRPMRQDCDDRKTSKHEEPALTHSGIHYANAFDGTGVQSTGDINISGSLHIHGNSSRKDEEKKQEEKRKRDARERHLSSLPFGQMDAREFAIRKAHTSTCQWILTNSQYKRWTRRRQDKPSDRFIWLKGKPGAGKSTMMKFLLQHNQKELLLSKGNDIIIPFFFNARGTALEKTTLGLYRNFLFQLLTKRPEAQTVLDRLLPTHEWTVPSLESIIEEAVLELENIPLICLIDALDEGDISEVRKMVNFFKDLTQIHRRLLVCLASRHYPHINIDAGLEIVLEQQPEHQDDIKRYLSARLKIGHDPLARRIRSDILAKASGVFMWVVLVVDILNQEFDAGRKHTLHERLEQLPKDLHNLFRDILTRDTKNVKALLLCIQWILFARRPLAPSELYFAIVSGFEPQHLQNCHDDSISETDIKRYILDNSKGLAEFGEHRVQNYRGVFISETDIKRYIVDNSKGSAISGEYRVQFVHESVVDFLLKENGLATIFSDLHHGEYGKSHDTLKSCCLKYMEFMDTIERRHQSTTPIIRSFPFAEYAQEEFIFHANQAETGGVDQKDFIADLNHGKWISSLQNSSHPKSCLYLFSEKAAASLIRAHPTGQSCFTIEDQKFAMPIMAAVSTGSIETTLELLELEVSRVSAFSFEDLCNEVSQSSKSDNNKASGFEFKRSVSTFVQLAKFAPELATIVFLRTNEIDVNATDHRGFTPLCYAATRQHSRLLEYLIDMGADLSVCDSRGAQFAHWAAQYGYLDTLATLDKHTCNVNARDEEGQTPLHYAMQPESDPSAIDVLLQLGAYIDARDQDGRTPLHHAICFYDLTKAEKLLSSGADVSVPDYKGQSLYSLALFFDAPGEPDRPSDIISLLQRHGADAPDLKNHPKPWLFDY